MSTQHWGERSDIVERGDGRHVLYIFELTIVDLT